MSQEREDGYYKSLANAAADRALEYSEKYIAISQEYIDTRYALRMLVDTLVIEGSHTDEPDVGMRCKVCSAMRAARGVLDKKIYS